MRGSLPRSDAWRPKSGEKQALRKLARNRRFEELEAALLAEIEGCGIDREEVVAILNLCVHRDEEEKAEALMWMILSAWTERRGAGSGLELLRGLAPLLPKSAALRGEADSLYRATRADHPGLASILRGTVLNEATPLGDAMRQADALLRFAPGAYFRERRGKVAGKALGVRETGDALLADMEGKERAFDLRAVGDLEPLPDDDVRVLLGFFPDRVAEAAGKDPAGLVERVLRTHGPLLSYRELRAVLNDLVPGGFAAFWNEASPRIRRSPWIEVSAGSQPTFELRRAALSHEARFRREFAETGPGLPRLLATLTYLEEAGEHAAQEPALTAILCEALRAEAGSSDPAIALGSLALLDRLARFRPDERPSRSRSWRPGTPRCSCPGSPTPS